MIIHKPRTLLWQLGSALMVVQAAAVLLLGWYAYSRFREFNQEQSMSELRRMTAMLAPRYASLVADTPVADPDSPIQREVMEDGRLSGLRLTVIAMDGCVLADSHRNPVELENHLQRPEIDAAIHHGHGSAVRYSTSVNEDQTYFAQVVRSEGRPVAVIRAARSVVALEQESARVARVVGTAGLVSLALTLLVVYLVSRQLSSSVSRLADSAARFAAGDLQHQIVRPASRELGMLAQALNHMAEQLNEQIDLLRSQRSEQQAIHQSMSNGMIALDLNQRVLSINRAAERLLGVDGSNARGRLLQELVREPELNRFVAKAIHDGMQSSAEFHMRGQLGATVQAVSEPLRNARDQPVGLLILINDVTQLRRLESIRSDFAANVSHELRTPITNIRGYVETMLDVGVKNEEQTARFLEIIKRNTDRLASIIEDLLALARLEQPESKATFERISTPISRIIEAVLTQFESTIEERGTKLHVEVPDDLEIPVNAQLIEQAVGNLLSNAIKYSPPRTRVTVTARCRGQEVEISVADQGPGIAPEHIPRLFERFYRVDRARSRELGGTGLGLAIVKHITLAHGGQVEVESSVGSGSVFRLILPIS